MVHPSRMGVTINRDFLLTVFRGARRPAAVCWKAVFVWLGMPEANNHMTTMRIITWNIRGARKSKSRAYLQRLVREYNVKVVVLLEIKMQSFSRRDANWILGKDWNFGLHPSLGMSAGNIVLWKEEIKLALTAVSAFMVACSITHWQDCTINCCFVYGPRVPQGRRAIWDAIRTTYCDNSPLLVAGDFNLIMGQEEKRGGRPFFYGSEQQCFADFMQDLQLADMGFSGNQFTWCNGKKGERACRAA
ncbi:hypothetical protein HPP92_013307 [Vanilla planifolia]|uniref:Endonuclease/exonuclease/phosphatase domain-containing protein n=1 Tax=Vanilla planifolia TaxID=51239 RepID=A0A835QVD0_VANPL|nr:hypothetical protein HPP92_013307 [Vanilla planifolia]